MPGMDELKAALERWRAAKPNSAEERKAARLMAFRISELLRRQAITDGPIKGQDASL